jgi:small GTP-binding protein
MMTETEIVLGSERLRVPRRVLITCGLFEKNPALLMRPYEVRSPVSPASLRTFLEAVQGSEIEFAADIMPDLAQLSAEFEFRLRDKRDSSADRFPFDLEGRIAALEELALNHDRRLSGQRTESERIVELETSIARLTEMVSRYSADLENLHREVQSIKEGYVAGFQAIREDVLFQINRVQPRTSNPVPPPAVSQSSKSGGKPPVAAAAQTIPLLVVGECIVGKSIMIHCFAEGDWNGYRPHSTVGVDYKQCTLTVKGKSVIVRLWDTASQERFRTITEAYLPRCHGVLVMYRRDLRYTFDAIPRWVDWVRKKSGPKLPILIVAWDLKTVTPQVSESEGRDLAEAMKTRIVELHGVQSVIQEAIVDFIETAIV